MSMTCDNCDRNLELTDSRGAIDEGSFTEEYQCASCKLTMTITGNAEDSPEQWQKYGAAYSE